MKNQTEKTLIFEEVNSQELNGRINVHDFGAGVIAGATVGAAGAAMAGVILT